jgi:para-nitrobenzyl esterase
MKKTFTLIATAMFFGTITTNAQCSGDRYKMQIFNGFDITSDILYGNNISYTGGSENLTLDVYEPAGDTETNRPLMIICHGGNFTSGSKTGSDVVPLAEDITKMGYVVASINYRKGFEGLFSGTLDSVFATETVVRAVHDYRAAIRYFKKDFSENGNTYGIDTSLIFASGVSAGAIAAVHVAYMNQPSEIPTYIDTNKVGLGGGIEGLSGNQGYSSTIAGVINIAGALRDTNWMQTNDTPILSFHGDQDATVPYGTDIIWLLGAFEIMRVDGSQSIHLRANNVGITNCFLTHYGEGHVPHVGNNLIKDTTLTYMSNFMSSIVCSETLNCGYDGTTVYLGIAEGNQEEVTVYPIPAASNITIQARSIIKEVQLMNLLGEIVLTKQGNNADNMQITRNQLPIGVYILSIKTDIGTTTKKISYE